MTLRLIVSLALLVFLGIALPLYFWNLIPEEVLVAVLSAGALPVLVDIARGIARRQLPLELPVLVTIVLLVVLDKPGLAGVFLLLILWGGLFRILILRKVRESVSALAKVLPDTAWRKTGEQVESVPSSALVPGDLLIVKSGEKVPVDGTLTSDEGLLDESVITGEANPVAKTKGDTLIAASINTGDPLDMIAKNTTHQSTVAQMHRLVEDAQKHATSLSRFSTRYAEATSIGAVVLVGAFYLVTRDIERALALWVSLVPVIFAVIVPVSTTIGISLLARSGILVKSAQSLENVTKIDTVCMDKTGTLTEGTPSLAAVVLAPGMDEPKALALAASLERYSEHRLAEPFLSGLEKQAGARVPIDDVQVLKGLGIEGRSDGRVVAIGSRALVGSLGAEIPDAIEASIEGREHPAATPVFLVRDGRVEALFYVSDVLRAEAPVVMETLDRAGYRTIMLTGDQPRAAEEMSRQAHIREFHAGLLPGEKVSVVAKLKTEGRTVLMVGDGLNDAPVLAQADVGVAMGLRGVDLTLEAAGVVLVHDDLSALETLFSVARDTFRTIKTNLVVATMIHLAAAGLVLAGSIEILGSAIIHQVSSTIVLLNTARLFLGEKRGHS